MPRKTCRCVAPGRLAGQLDEAAAAIAGLLGQMAARQETAELVRVVLAGRPTAARAACSTPWPARRALVSDQPGTTRDYLAAELDLDGVRCQLVDTAGIEARGDCPSFCAAKTRLSAAVIPSAISAAAQAASRQQHEQADVQVVVSTRPGRRMIGIAQKCPIRACASD